MSHVGRPMKRVEDRPLLLGVGRYTDDLTLPGTVHVHFVRSAHAHARVRLDVGAARQATGVLAVVTAADLASLGHLPANPMLPGMKVAPFPMLAGDVVRSVGEPVAAVVAETAALARDAAERVAVEYEPLKPAVEAPDARQAGAPVLYDVLGTNEALVASWKLGDVDGAFAGARAVARVGVSQPRVSAVAMEPRAVLARHDAPTGELTIWTSTQAPFRVRAEVATLLGLPESRVRAVAPDVGGGFGVKGDVYREEIVVAWLALRLGRPVKWVSTRGEDFLTTKQGRGSTATGEIAVAADGAILGLRAQVEYPLGLHLMFSGAVPPFNHGRLIPGAYVMPAIDITSRASYTTTPPLGPYRGAGRPEGIFFTERLLDEAARALGMDPAEIRRRNFVPREAFPYKSAAGFVYDSGDYAAAFEKALALADYPGLRRRQREARERGVITGVGLASYVENAALGWESGSVRVERTGAVTVVTGSSPHGQGHETTWAQIVADALGVEPEVIAVRHGDTHGVAQGFGTFGSRSTALGGGALVRAAGEIREKGRRIAAFLLEAAPADVRPVDGGFQVAGVPARGMTWRQVATAAYGVRLPPGDDPGLEATAFFRAEAETWSFGSCVVTVDVDRDTGRVALTSCVWVDDAGTIVNPLLAEGQLHGSYAQGVGQALLEALVYDREGQLLTASLMDYAVPRADDFIEPVLDKTVTPSPRNPLGAKGLGEAGCIAVPPAIVNAVVDALSPFGLRHLDMPLTPEKVWRALRGT
ncbi:MAG: xanthine dehydrogenase family protein [Candidatus Rokubacteria bacterium]|nr:xanthine dehydrogenase family protein [Candidatus Rokubacteria bacterium]MBI3825109.1 xanthine dehydrogenase family protein [Candidatus Rokubacteria bacterium]